MKKYESTKQMIKRLDERMSKCEALIQEVSEQNKADAHKRIELMRLQRDTAIKEADQRQLKLRMDELCVACGENSPEERVLAASNYEFGLRIMKKQCEDQLIYTAGGDKNLISTMEFKSVEEMSNAMLSMINVLLRNSSPTGIIAKEEPDGK